MKTGTLIALLAAGAGAVYVLTRPKVATKTSVDDQGNTIVTMTPNKVVTTRQIVNTVLKVDPGAAITVTPDGEVKVTTFAVSINEQLAPNSAASQELVNAVQSLLDAGAPGVYGSDIQATDEGWYDV